MMTRLPHGDGQSWSIPLSFQHRFTFKIGNDRESFELPMWIEASTQDDAMVPKARAELLEITRQFVEQTTKWCPPA